uniref:Uncharacterized protein n=1 Tax=Magallana gigas TaxID=29159 RepID=K1QIR7_MAGGI
MRLVQLKMDILSDWYFESDLQGNVLLRAVMTLSMFTPWELITMSFMNITNMVQNETSLLGYQFPIPFTAHRTAVASEQDQAFAECKKTKPGYRVLYDSPDHPFAPASHVLSTAAAIFPKPAKSIHICAYPCVGVDIDIFCTKVQIEIDGQYCLLDESLATVFLSEDGDPETKRAIREALSTSHKNSTSLDTSTSSGASTSRVFETIPSCSASSESASSGHSTPSSSDSQIDNSTFASEC